MTDKVGISTFRKFAYGDIPTYATIAGTDSVEALLDPAVPSDSYIETLRVVLPTLTSDFILSPYLYDNTNTFPNDRSDDIESYSSRPKFYVGDKNILVFAFACKFISMDDIEHRKDKFTFTPVLYGGNSDVLLSTVSPINMDMSIGGGSIAGNFGNRIWKRNNDFYISRIYTRIIGAATDVKMLCRYVDQRNDDGGSKPGYITNLDTGIIYLGAI